MRSRRMPRGVRQVSPANPAILHKRLLLDLRPGVQAKNRDAHLHSVQVRRKKFALRELQRPGPAGEGQRLSDVPPRIRGENGRAGPRDRGG